MLLYPLEKWGREVKVVSEPQKTEKCSRKTASPTGISSPPGEEGEHLHTGHPKQFADHRRMLGLPDRCLMGVTSAWRR